MLTYTIPEKRNKPIYEYIYTFIKDDILHSRLKPNDKLPSKRTFAKQLNVSLITIEKAYEQLIIEGYIYTIEKSGYYVEEIEEPSFKEIPSIEKEKEEKMPSLIYSRFPYSIWNSISRKVLSDNSGLIPSPFKGQSELRRAISRHLLDFYSMNVSEKSIVIGAGSEYLYTLLIQYFGLDKIYALEDPGHLNIAKVYKANNATYKYISLDESGISAKELLKSGSDIVHISPAHHFPTGITMPLKRRMELLKWANNKKGFIIEDDYDSEYRFSGKPIQPLYELDNSGRVIYMNTFTKTLSPAFRIAYMVLPKGMENDFEEKLGFYHNTVSSNIQMVLARFISEGYFERHIFRERKYYKELRKVLLQKMESVIEKYSLKIIEADSGLHFLVEHSFKSIDEEIELLFKKYNLNMHTLSYYSMSPTDLKRIVISYSDIRIEEVNDYVNNFERVLKHLKENNE